MGQPPVKAIRFKSQILVAMRLSNVARLSEHNATLTNNTPSNLNPTGALTILENMAAGTTVGEFNATDSDAGAILTYSLSAGAGDGNNSLFTLESNGTLKSAAPSRL